MLDIHEVHELIISSLHCRTSPQDEARLVAWRTERRENELHYRAVSTLWAITGAAAPEAFADPPNVSEVVASARASEKVDSRQRGHVRVLEGLDHGRAVARTPAPWRRVTAAGLVAASLVAVGAGLGVNLDAGPESPPMLDESETVTGAGEMTTLTLADGSSIRLGPQSRLRLSEGRVHRLAWLEGRAFFGVHADSTRPFIVRTPSGDATALGTRFEVRAEEDFEVLVVEGRVSVTAGGAQVAVAGGELSRSVGGARPTTEVVSNIYERLEWLGNAVVFNATPLERVAEELEQRYGARVTIEVAALRELTVTAAFTGQSVDEVVAVICEAVGAECDVNEEEIRIRARTGVAPVWWTLPH
jgi:ferric-dicitrate binding protein FerR (iron transport regulator)